MSESQESTKEAFQRKCSILISLIASMLLINNLGSQNSGSSAAFLNASAINTYAFFQAKSIRQNDLNLTANTLDAIVDTSPTVNESTKQVIRDKAEAMRAKAKSYDSDPESGEGKKRASCESQSLGSCSRCFHGEGAVFRLCRLATSVVHYFIFCGVDH